MVVEFWVMRVLLHPGPQRRPVTFNTLPNNEHAAAMAHVARGDLTVLPDNSIAEPVEMFSSQLEADGHREQLQLAMPGEDFRVILNSSVTV
jgi:hypothetical protein